MRSLILSCSLAALVLASACGEDDMVTAVAPAACNGVITLHVSAGLTPTFSWTPQCGANFIEVQGPVTPATGGFPTVMGPMSVPENWRFGSPIVYGSKPPAAFVNNPPLPLQA